MREEDDFRGKKKRVAINSADAESYIRSCREDRLEFEKNEGRPLDEFVQSEEAERLHAQHASHAQDEQKKQLDFQEEHQQQVDQQKEHQEKQREQHQEQQEQGQERQL